MKLNEIDKQLTTDDLEALETFADRIFAKVGIDVEFTRHFLDRVNDERNGKQITASELTRLFKQEYKKWGKPIAKMGPDAEAVMKDLQTDINMPFVLSWDKENEELDLIAKTVMRKPDFKTSNREFTVEGETLIPYVSMDWGLWKAAHRGRISFDERLSEYIDNAGGQGSEGHMKMWSRFKKNHGIKNMTTDEKEETFLYQKMKSMKKWEHPKLEEEDAGLYYDNVKKKDYSKYKGEQIYELRQQLKSIRQTLLNLQDVDPKDGSSDMQNDIKSMLRGYDELTTAMVKAENKLLGEGIAEDDLSELGRGLFSMGGRSGLRHTGTIRSRTSSASFLPKPIKKPSLLKRIFSDEFSESKDYNLMAQRATMNLSDQAIVALIADLYKQLDRQVNEETTQCTACDGTGWDRSVTSDEDDRGCDECGGTGEIEVLEEHNVQVKGSDPWPKAKPGRTDHPFIGKLVGSKYNEEEYGLADTRQKRIAIDTVKNPSKALLGGPSASEAEDILKTKFGYSDKQIAKLKELNEELSIAQKQQRRRNRMNAHLQKTMKKYADAEKAGIHPSRVNQRRTQMTVKKESRLSLYDTLMKMKESDIEEFEKDFSKLNEFTLVDVKDMIKKGWMSRPTEKQWKELIKIYNKYKGNVTRKDLIDVGIATLGRKESVKETGGVGKVVPGVNTSVDVGPNEIKKQAAKFGNAVDKDGVPKKNLR